MTRLTCLRECKEKMERGGKKTHLILFTHLSTKGEELCDHHKLTVYFLETCMNRNPFIQIQIREKRSSAPSFKSCLMSLCIGMNSSKFVQITSPSKEIRVQLGNPITNCSFGFLFQMLKCVCLFPSFCSDGPRNRHRQALWHRK